MPLFGSSKPKPNTEQLKANRDIDFIIPQAKVVLGGTSLIFRRGRLSSETVSLSLDSLRLVYLFFPAEFKWRLIRPSQYRYQYQNLDVLSEDAFLELHAALSQQPRFLMGGFTFVLADFEGRVVTVSWKKLADSGIDLMIQLGRHRAARRERLARWRQGNPSITIRAKGASFRGDVNLNAAGISSRRGRFVPWDALERIGITQYQSPLGNVCYFEFAPTKASGIKKIVTGVAPKQTEACLAEFDFWRSPGQRAEQPGHLAAPLPAPAPAPPTATTPLAVVSLVAGVATWVLLPLIGAIVAVITGHLAHKEIRNSEGKQGGKGLATAGLVLGYGQLGLAVLLLVLLLAS